MKEQLTKLLADKSVHEDAKECLGIFRENLQKADAASVRQSAIFLFLAVSFELLNRAAISEISIAGLKVSDLGLVQKVLPVGIAYYYYAALSSYSSRRLLMEVIDRTVEHVYPKLYEADWHVFMYPPSG